jgi:hypothetical protein
MVHRKAKASREKSRDHGAGEIPLRRREWRLPDDSPLQARDLRGSSVGLQSRGNVGWKDALRRRWREKHEEHEADCEGRSDAEGHNPGYLNRDPPADAGPHCRTTLAEKR